MAETLLAAYAAIGQDKPMMERVAKKMETHLDPAFIDFNKEEVLATGDVEPQDFVASLNQLPFGPGYRMVLVRDAQRLSKATTEAFMGYLDNPNPQTVVLLLFDSLAKNTRLYKKLSTLGRGAIIPCESKKQYQLEKFVSEAAYKYGFKLDPLAADELFKRVGESETMIVNALQTLASIPNISAYLDAATIRRYVAYEREIKPWHVVDAMFERNAPRALELLRAFKQDELAGIVFFTAERLRELICVASYGGNINVAAGELKKQAWQLKGHAQTARMFGLNRLIACLQETLICEQALKSTGNGQNALVQLVLFVACDAKSEREVMMGA